MKYKIEEMLDWVERIIVCVIFEWNTWIILFFLLFLRTNCPLPHYTTFSPSLEVYWQDLRGQRKIMSRRLKQAERDSEEKKVMLLVN